MPQWRGRFKKRSSIAQFSGRGPGLIAGQLHVFGKRCLLVDQSGEFELSRELQFLLPQRVHAWVAFEFRESDAELVYFQPLTRPPLNLEKRNRRFQLLQHIRNFFLQKDFLETDTPIRVINPGMEPFLDSFEVQGKYLRTSPELHMKRLLCAGFDRIFQFAPSFRKGDHSRIHREEFCMLEWYRNFADLEDIAQDCEALLQGCAKYASRPEFFSQQLQRITCHQAFQKYVGLDLRDHVRCEPLIHAARKHGVHHQTGDDWDTLFFRLFLNIIEPHLGQEAPTILTDYPASQAALAKKNPHTRPFPTCFRFELYVGGMELANAFYEVTDAKEQRVRFQADQAERARLQKPVYPMDEAFLAALEGGMPPCAGIALGLDRLILCLLGLEDLSEILPF